MDNNITSDKLAKLESILKIKRINCKEEFDTITNHEKFIIYFLVNWSGYERISRYFFFNSMKNKNDLPCFIVDCSNQKLDWLNKKIKGTSLIQHQGNGEILFIKNNIIYDSILNSHQIGLSKTKQIISTWR